MEHQKRCETCKFLDEEKTPCECKKGRGRVAYRHSACEEYKEDKNVESANSKIS